MSGISKPVLRMVKERTNEALESSRGLGKRVESLEMWAEALSNALLAGGFRRRLRWLLTGK
jgi:hypothetical protein